MANKKFFLSIIIFLFSLSSFLYSGTVRRDSQFWDVKIYKTKNPLEADIIVYNASSFEEANGKDYIWKWSPFGKTAIKFVDNIDDAELVVYFTANKKLARWKRLTPLKGKFLE